MMLELIEVLEDWREEDCMICGESCNPQYRFLYHSRKKDKHGNPLIDDEIICCRRCCSDVRKDWKKFCDSITSIIILKRIGVYQ